MKMLIAAIAMMIASPAFAQAAPMANHAHQAAQSAPSEQTQTSHPPRPASDGHADHDMSAGNMDCCKKAADGIMACCAKTEAQGGEPVPCCGTAEAESNDTSAGADSDPHAGHTMLSQ